MRIGAAVNRLARHSLGRWVWFETYRCMRLPWKEAQDAAASVAASADVEVRLLPRSELQRYRSEAGYEFSAGFLEGLASRDDLCVGAFSAGRLVSSCFFAVMPTAIDADLRFHFPVRWIYVYKAHTLPPHRGRGLQQELFRRALPDVRTWLSGLRAPAGFVTLVMTHNRPSLRAFRRLGFEPFASFSALRIGARPRLVLPSEDEAREFYIAMIAG